MEVDVSSMHLIGEGVLFNRILQQVKGPFTVLTSNPDRLTRRAQEVGLILRSIHRLGGVWMTQGCRRSKIQRLAQRCRYARICGTAIDIR